MKFTTRLKGQRAVMKAKHKLSKKGHELSKKHKHELHDCVSCETQSESESV